MLKCKKRQMYDMQNKVSFYVGIIGAGKMGKSLFKLMTQHGFGVVWITKTDQTHEFKRYKRKLARDKRYQLVSEAEYFKRLNNTFITNDTDKLLSCSIIIETITESIELKNKLFQKIANHINSSAILVSNTSSIVPNSFILPKSLRKRFAILHFFYPAETNSLVELIPCHDMQTTTINQLKSFCQSTGKLVFLQKNDAAFFINRFFLDIQSGLFNYCVQHNIPFSTADFLIKKNYLSIGIFEMIESIGASLMADAISNYRNLSPGKISPEPLHCFLKEHQGCHGNSNSSMFFGKNDHTKLSNKTQGAFINYIEFLFKDTCKHYMDIYDISNQDFAVIISEYSAAYDANLLLPHNNPR